MISSVAVESSLWFLCSAVRERWGWVNSRQARCSLPHPAVCPHWCPSTLCLLGPNTGFNCEIEVLTMFIVFNGKIMSAFPFKCPLDDPRRQEEAYIRIHAFFSFPSYSSNTISFPYSSMSEHKVKEWICEIVWMCKTHFLLLSPIAQHPWSHYSIEVCLFLYRKISIATQ